VNLDKEGQSQTIGLRLKNEKGLENVVLVKAGYATEVAHEIGHTPPYRLKDEYKSSRFGGADYVGPPTNGFWVSEKEAISNGKCFMGAGVGEFLHRYWIWICDKDYKRLFEASVSK
jgi:hypothetical protein